MKTAFYEGKLSLVTKPRNLFETIINSNKICNNTNNNILLQIMLLHNIICKYIINNYSNNEKKFCSDY